MVAVNALRVVFFNMPFMIEFYLRQAMPCFIKRDDVFNSLVFRFDSGMTLLALYRAVLLFVAVFAERVKYYHL